MKGRGPALMRLFSVQGDWNYERMLGIGMGYAAEPLLDDLAVTDPARHAEATARAAEFFNCNPNLAGLALGATVRAEHDGVPAAQIQRLRAALCSPLGALGDRFFWAGLVPALSGAAVAAAALGAGLWAAVGFVLVYAAVRIGVARWSLDTGLAAGVGVGQAISRSWLPRAVPRLDALAGFSVGAAVPVAAGWLLTPFGRPGAAAALLVAAVGVAASRWLQGTFTAVRFALLIAGLILLLRWVMA